MKLPIYQADLARLLGISRMAINARVMRGTLPPFDGKDDKGRGYWTPETVQKITPNAAEEK
jgi:hypothetical protein